MYPSELNQAVEVWQTVRLLPLVAAQASREALMTVGEVLHRQMVTTHKVVVYIQPDSDYLHTLSQCN